MDRVKYIVNLVIVVLLFAAIAIGKDGRIGGWSVDDWGGDESEEVATPSDIERVMADGTRVINSRSLASEVVGFASLTPVDVYVQDGIISKIEVAENSETPSYLEMVVKSGLYNRWNGMSLRDAAQTPIDAVSGATFSSTAIIKNVQLAAQYGANVEAVAHNPFAHLSLKDLIGALVIALGVTITLMRPRSKAWEVAHMGLNVVVLGFWCGSFLSLAQIVAWCANGVQVSLTALLLIVVVLMPLLGRRGSYCHLHCPMGSAQHLLGLLPLPKLNLGVEATKMLNNLRYYILAILLFMMWLGVGFDLMNYEIFSVFLLGSASTFVLIMAGMFLALSLVILRPYCRFICPTGALITMSQLVKRD